MHVSRRTVFLVLMTLAILISAAWAVLLEQKESIDAAQAFLKWAWGGLFGIAMFYIFVLD